MKLPWRRAQLKQFVPEERIQDRRRLLAVSKSHPYGILPLVERLPAAEIETEIETFAMIETDIDAIERPVAVEVDVGGRHDPSFDLAASARGRREDERCKRPGEEAEAHAVHRLDS